MWHFSFSHSPITESIQFGNKILRSQESVQKLIQRGKVSTTPQAFLCSLKSLAVYAVM